MTNTSFISYHILACYAVMMSIIMMLLMIVMVILFPACIAVNHINMYLV